MDDLAPDTRVRCSSEPENGVGTVIFMKYDMVWVKWDSAVIAHSLHNRYELAPSGEGDQCSHCHGTGVVRDE